MPYIYICIPLYCSLLDIYIYMYNYGFVRYSYQCTILIIAQNDAMLQYTIVFKSKVWNAVHQLYIILIIIIATQILDPQTHYQCTTAKKILLYKILTYINLQPN